MSPRQRLLITIAVMATTVMQVLDTTIVNVALPHMEGQLEATPDQITWVLTSYLVASAVFMPLTGFFTDRLGRRRYLLISIFGFVLFSALCGLAASLDQIVVFRLLQGAFGASLVPLSQAILVSVYPIEERGRAMAIWGIGVMIGPILGPTLGGYLTEVLSWRWTFFINLPVGILSYILALTSVPDTPRQQRAMDWGGLAYLALCISALQFLLDRGNEYGWLGSLRIQLAAVISVAGLAAFTVHSAGRRKSRLFDLRILADRNFTVASFLLAIFGLGMYGSMVMQPLFLETLLHYPTLTTGLVMAPRGVVSALSMLVVGRLITRMSPRILITIGIILSGLGTWAMGRYDLHISEWQVIWPVLIQGMGLGMIYVPLSTVAFSTLPRESAPEAAGLFSLMRTVGSSIGISLVTTMFIRHGQMAWNTIGAHITAFGTAAITYLAPLHLLPQTPLGAEVLAGTLARQSQMVAFDAAFVFITMSFVAMLPLVLLIGDHRLGGEAASVVVAD
ncbi:DHA2 family efflux MFS transporter permease subunit [Acidiferrobacter sp.]|uniref:DHA2 family efflux MFS transporter permease subunit n=1 Tax=Acidiferrobacter sp. TaxID=1872107 RepID=UPI00260A4632|nr:DHA2 family efflux MFS transporter permease subunit [Acidiferrobacter sp.]